MQELSGVEEKLQYEVDQKTQDLQAQMDAIDYRVSIALTLLHLYIDEIVLKQDILLLPWLATVGAKQTLSL